MHKNSNNRNNINQKHCLFKQECLKSKSHTNKLKKEIILSNN